MALHCYITRLFLQILVTMPPSLLCHFLSVPKGGIVSKFDCRCKIVKFPNSVLVIRGRVEDTRLEAKDTKKSEAKAKDSLSEDRHSRGQGQECSRPRPRTKDTSASALQKKKGLHKNFSSDLHKKTFSKKFFKRSTKF